ncbi:MAG: hypothetical protein GWP08_13025 [Nitrospiraceae bacterium]|nr:hypothetical protein [Nitrospiraceae bacterium]
MSRAWRLSLCSLAAVCLFGAAAWSQDINSSPSPVGSGARALGMGGAFIAIADDATAASWNPAGLTQLERPELSLVYSWKRFGEDFSNTPHLSPYEDGFSINLDDINYASFVYPLPWTLLGRNFVVSLNYQRKYDFDRSLNLRFRDLNPILGPFAGASSVVASQVDYEQKGSLSALSPAFAFEVTDRLSLGLAVNIWDSSLLGGNGWETSTERHTTAQTFINLRDGGFFSGLVTGYWNTYEKYEDVKGINYTFGLLYKPTERLSIGAVYHTAFSTDVKYTRLDRLSQGLVPMRYVSDLRIEWPGAIGVGAAYRFPNDKLTLSLDVTRRNWDRFVQIDRRGTIGMFPTRNGAARTSPITGMDKWHSPHDPTYTVRLGAEYVFINPKKAKQDYLPSLRAGLFYDPEPASGRRDAWWGVKRGGGDPDDYYGVALGAGLLVKNRVNIDIAYQYRWGTNVRKDTLADGGVFERGFSADVEQHLLYLSTVIYF